MTADHPLRRLGLYNATYSSAVQFNSIVFRVVVGVLTGTLLDAVAVATAVEFALNALLEIPFGVTADRFGRSKVALFGLAAYVGSTLCLFAAVWFHEITGWAYFFVVADGVLCGIGKPLLSGSTESFYQNAIHDWEERHPQEKSVAGNSFTLSLRFGRYFTSVAVLAAFALAYVLTPRDSAHWAFLPGAALYGVAFFLLFQDRRRWPEVPAKTSSSRSLEALWRLFRQTPALRLSTSLVLLFYVVAAAVLGYLLVALGRQLRLGGAVPWVPMASFMLGYLTLGWIAKSTVLPFFSERLSRRNYLFAALAILSGTGGAFFAIMPLLGGTTWPIALFVFGALFQLSGSALFTVAVNLALAHVPRRDFATAMSLQAMPGYAWTAIYSTALAVFAQGAPSVPGIFLTVAGVPALALGYFAWRYPRGGSAWQ